ncbi:MAG: hypothetical protein JNK05_40110 [Myxococcales bacterium]|nr:hypothetical protein [Myxococcales bacterium]
MEQTTGARGGWSLAWVALALTFATTARPVPALARPTSETVKSPRSNELVLAPMRVPLEFPEVDGVAPTVIEAPTPNPTDEHDVGEILRRGARCDHGARVYFDERENLYRPCPADTARTPASRATIDRRMPSRCRPGDAVYYDARDQLFRPCDDSTTSTSRASRRPNPPSARRASSRAHCSAGQAAYFDELNQIYRPCP